jgi:hypothetical protein
MKSIPCENCVVYPVCRNRLISLAKKRATSYNVNFRWPITIAEMAAGSVLLDTSFLKCNKLERYIWKLIDNSYHEDDILNNPRIVKDIISEHSVIIFSLTKTEMDSIEKEAYNEIDTM